MNSLVDVDERIFSVPPMISWQSSKTLSDEDVIVIPYVPPIAFC